MPTSFNDVDVDQFPDLHLCIRGRLTTVWTKDAVRKDPSSNTREWHEAWPGTTEIEFLNSRPKDFDMKIQDSKARLQLFLEF